MIMDIIENTIVCLDEGVSFTWNTGSSQPILRKNVIVSETSLNFSLKAFLAQSTLQQFLLPLNICSTWQHVSDSSDGFVFNCYLPFSEGDPVFSNWIICYVRAGVLCSFLCLIAPSICLADTVESYHTLNLICAINSSSSGQREGGKNPLFNPSPSLLKVASGLCCPQGKGSYSHNTKRPRILILGFLSFQGPRSQLRNFHE